jgi:hypothetical protein
MRGARAAIVGLLSALAPSGRAGRVALVAVALQDNLGASPGNIMLIGERWL